MLGLAAFSCARKMNIPAVASYHTSFVSYLKYYGFGSWERRVWKYLRWFYNNAEAIFVPSKSTIEELRSQGFDNLMEWGRGIDVSRFSPRFADQKLRQEWSPEGFPVLLFVGRLVKEKDIDVLIESCRLLHEKGFQFKIVLSVMALAR